MIDIIINKDKRNLFLISFLVLYFELVFIRYLASNIHLLGFFSNTILLASFIGMGIGCVLSEKKSFISFISPVMFLLTISIAIIFFHKNIHLTLSPSSSKEDIFFGSIFYARRLLKVPIYLVLSVIFFIVSIIFIDLGKRLGVLFGKFPPLEAYKINIAGSLAGITVFSVISFFSLSAYYWFLFGNIILYITYVKYLCKPKKILYTIVLITSFILTVYSQKYQGFDILWSPYYKIVLRGNEINVNTLDHQQMQGPREKRSFIYNFPYLLLKQFNKKNNDVLIIGAGSGNDVAGSILNNSNHIDAVEIDPEIIKIGRNKHPFKPYNYSNVKMYCDDGRSFLKKTDKKYDLICYGIVDSLTKLSTYSNIRLENYLFTVEAFEDVRKHLKQNGVFVLYNSFRESWLAIKIYHMLGKAFQQKPLMFILHPATKTISINDKINPRATAFFTGDISAINEMFEDNYGFVTDYNNLTGKIPSSYFIKNKESVKDLKNKILLVKTNIKEKEYKNRLSTDNWPFLYLRKPKIPKHNLYGMFIILTISLFLMLILIKFKSLKSDNLCFLFLGSAFMLLETKSVTVFALAFGTTWLVNSIVFAGILIVIYLANYCAINYKLNIKLIYFLLILSILISYLVPVSFVLAFNFIVKFILINLLHFLPIFFAGILFSNYLKCGSDSSSNLGFNLIGVIIGGILENLSLITGYQNLLILVIILYLITFPFRKRLNLP